MGFSGGTDIACGMARAISFHVANPFTRKLLYTELVNRLNDADWDTQNEAAGIDPILDTLLGLEEE